MSKPTAQVPTGDALRKTARLWLDRIEAAKKREKHWRDGADAAVKAYTGEGGKSESGHAEDGVAYDFNILLANVETIVPAVINSPPAPDIRRRFGSDDPVAKDFAELLERAIRVQVDDGRLQVEMEAMAQDGFLAGRGLIRLRFKGDFSTDIDPADEESGENASKPDGAVSNERIGFEAVPWADAVHGPAKRWEDVPWWAFRHHMQQEDIDDFSDAATVEAQSKPDDHLGDDDSDRVVWEIWEKKSRDVVFVAERDDGRVLKRVPDPLKLSRFFPIATPVQPIEVNGRLMPVNPFSIYRRLADELDTSTKRIRVITKQLRVKGAYGFDPASLAAILDADDNEFIPIADPEVWAANGGLEKAIVFWPVEKLIVVLTQLYALREQTKQAIYELTGISDIVRGASQASETATAQQIKSQWGSLRIQKMQRMMERAARDLFVMMSEIIPTMFSPETLFRMTEIQVAPTEEDQQPIQPPPPPRQTASNGGPRMGAQEARQDPALAEYQQAVSQARAAEQARQAKLQHLAALQDLMRQKAASYYRIDVETDSTVKADLTRQKAEASEFMGAASQYFAAVAPLVQQGALPMQVAVEIFSSFSRMFNLGKSVEDALDELVTQAKDKAGQPPEADPAQAAAKAESDAKMQAMQADMQAKQQEGALKMQAAQRDMDIRQKAAEADLSSKMLDRQGKEVDLAIRQKDLEIRGYDLMLKQKQLLQPQSGSARPVSMPTTGGFGIG